MRSPLSLHSPSWLHRRHLGSPLWPVTDKSPLSPQSRLHLSSLGFPQALRFIISTHVGIGSISVICPLFLCILGWSHPLVQLSYFFLFLSFPFLFPFLFSFPFFFFLSPPKRSRKSAKVKNTALEPDQSAAHPVSPLVSRDPQRPFPLFFQLQNGDDGQPHLKTMK